MKFGAITLFSDSRVKDAPISSVGRFATTTTFARCTFKHHGLASSFRGWSRKGRRGWTRRAEGVESSGRIRSSAEIYETAALIAPPLRSIRQGRLYSRGRAKCALLIPHRNPRLVSNHSSGWTRREISISSRRVHRGACLRTKLYSVQLLAS